MTPASMLCRSFAQLALTTFVSVLYKKRSSHYAPVIFSHKLREPVISDDLGTVHIQCGRKITGKSQKISQESSKSQVFSAPSVVLISQ
jgi:hypothetical protein